MARPGRTVLLAAAAALLGVALAAGVWLAGGAEEENAGLPVAEVGPRILFDDFRQLDGHALAAAGWIVRAAAGPPGIRGAAWGGVSLAGEGLRLIARTDGTAAGTMQALVCHAPKYRDGTSAARIRLRDRPVSGPPLDAPTESFSGAAATQRARGEFAFDYRPAGEVPTLELAAPIGAPLLLRGSRDGWHVLAARVAAGEVAYFVDGERVGLRRGRGGPGVSALALGLWFEAVAAGAPRRWELDVDWIFHQADAALSPKQVAAAVGSLRRLGIGFQDTVPEQAATRSPCGAG